MVRGTRHEELADRASLHRTCVSLVERARRNLTVIPIGGDEQREGEHSEEDGCAPVADRRQREPDAGAGVVRAQGA